MMYIEISWLPPSQDRGSTLLQTASFLQWIFDILRSIGHILLSLDGLCVFMAFRTDYIIGTLCQNFNYI